MTSGRFSVLLDYDDYQAANWLWIRRKWLWRGALRFIFIVGTIYALIGIMIDLIAGERLGLHLITDVAAAFGLATAVLLVLALYWRWSIPRAVRKSFDQLQLGEAPNTYCFSGDGMSVAGGTGTAELEWHHLVRWIEDDRSLLMFRSDLLFFAIPKAQVEEAELQSLKSVMDTAGVPQR